VFDLQMPEMDSFEVLDRLKRHPGTQKIPAIVRSSLQLDLETRNSLTQQCITILSKEASSQAAATFQLREALVKSGLILEM
jgi:CheY-like chemotaxis protein